jgi:hypothetical protein
MVNKENASAELEAPPPDLVPESALRLHPCRALPSAPVRISVERHDIRPTSP